MSKSMWVGCRGLFSTDSEALTHKTNVEEDLTVRLEMVDRENIANEVEGKPE